MVPSNRHMKGKKKNYCIDENIKLLIAVLLKFVPNVVSDSAFYILLFTVYT
jgi:hypothetical protein